MFSSPWARLRNIIAAPSDEIEPHHRLADRQCRDLRSHLGDDDGRAVGPLGRRLVFALVGQDVLLRRLHATVSAR